jgi:hypothetical protein
MQKIIKALLFAVVVTAASAATTPPVPPTKDPDHQGVVFSVKPLGTPPMKYQWYRGTATNPKKVKLEGPFATEPNLELSPPFIAGLYSCEVTNAAGTILYDPQQLATTTSKTAPRLKVTVKVP